MNDRCEIFRESIRNSTKNLGVNITSDAVESLFMCVYDIRRDNILDVDLAKRIVEKANRILKVDEVFIEKRDTIEKRDIIVAYECIKDYERKEILRKS